MGSSKVPERLPENLSEAANNDDDDDDDALHTVSAGDTIKTIDGSRQSSLVRQSAVTFNPSVSEEEFMMFTTQATSHPPNREEVQVLGNIVAMHLGAGYHSRINEGRHRELGKRIAYEARTLLQTGYMAEHVAIACTKLLEDDPLTNAGFGSNLTIDGVVEGDATVIDGYGRFGSVSAVTQVKNPVVVAATIREQANKGPLSCNRLAPNMLVGEGAADFAYNSGLPLLPLDMNISGSARERWNTWSKDMQDFNLRNSTKPNRELTPPSTPEHRMRFMEKTNDARLRHVTTMLASVSIAERNPIETTYEQFQSRTRSSSIYSRQTSSQPESPMMEISTPVRGSSPEIPQMVDGPIERDVHTVSDTTPPATSMQPLDEMTTITVAENSTQSEVYFEPNDDEDKINDTVGVIVIDRMGNLATASSSGGLGMKLRGRAGPAAILGAGTAVMPADKDDPEKTMVAVVASGTGEYISSTMAATFAAERLYYSQKKIVGGKLVECDDSEVLEAFIQKEFMGHPSVINRGDKKAKPVIGLLAVKATKTSIRAFYAHNSASFCIATLSPHDREPATTMSRLKEAGTGVASAGRKLAGGS